mgnify:CR=1 FL=1
MDNILHILDTPIIMIHCADFFDIGLSHPQVQKFEICKASKTEILDLFQLPRPKYEIHKMINLPDSVKIFKNKLKKLRN